MKQSLLHYIIRIFVTVFFLSAFAAAQNGDRLGTPAENKGGVSWSSSYATDKIETVNMTNGNLTIQLPLVSIGGRGSAGVTVMLSYNSKLWGGAMDRENIGSQETPEYINHFGTKFNDENSGAGWKLSAGPKLKRRAVEIDPYTAGCSDSGCYKYVLTKLWITLADGSEVEIRDADTNGAPYLRPSQTSVDRDRGRIWKSTDGSFITFVTDANNGVVTGDLDGWAFLSDGTRMRFEDGLCIQIIDRNGNKLTIDYGTLNANAITYVDQLGRQVILGSGGLTLKGYGGASDRTIQIINGEIIPEDDEETAVNLRSDYQSIERPVVNGDWVAPTGYHAISGDHTDLFEVNDVPSDVLFLEEMGGRMAVTEVTLLDGRKFKFRYNPFGEVAEIVYPGGGRSQIDYVPTGSLVCEGGPMGSITNRKVSQRRLQADGANVESTWLYDIGGKFDPVSVFEVREGSSTGTLMTKETHYFLGIDDEYRVCTTGPAAISKKSGYEKWGNGKVWKVVKETGSGTIATEKTFEQREQVSWPDDPGSSVNAYVEEHGQEQPSNDPRVAYEDVILEDGKMKRTEFAYDQFNNVTLITERDFGTAGNPGAVLRKTQKTYLAAQNGYCYTNLNGLSSSCADGIPSNIGAVVHQRHVLLSEKVLDASDNQKALAEYEYDNYSSDSNHASIVANSSMINYEGGRFGLFSSSSEPRGNATRVRNWAGGSDYIYAYTQYDNAGNVIKTKDPNGNVSTIFYTDNFGNGTIPDTGAGGNFGATFAFPTLATNALGWQSKVQYDFTLGAAAGTKDINDVISRVEFDSIGRPFRTTAAYGTSLAVKTEASYPTATSNVATSSSQLTETTWKAAKVEYDGFDRAVLSSTAEDGKHASEATFTIFSKTVYDALSRARFQTNPYRSASSTTDGWTRMKYDLAGRAVETATFSGSPATLPPATGTNSSWTGSVTTDYDGTATTVTDQAGKLRRSIINALGQLARVDEPNSSNQLGAVSSPNQATNYSYDPLGKMIRVQQGDQNRYFIYDSLGRLLRFRQPEQEVNTALNTSGNPDNNSWAAGMTYDANGNVLTTTDAKDTTITITYDALNRPLSRTYEDGTPTVNLYYDGNGLSSVPDFSKGQLTKVTNGISATEYVAFDNFGRLTRSKQITDGVTYGTDANPMTYTYNLSGALIEQQYPSGRKVQNTLDADGALEMVKSRKNTNHGYFSYANNFSYNAAGAVTSMQLGNGRWESTVFNSKLQPTQIALGTVQNGHDQLRLRYTYGDWVSGTINEAKNNGNIVKQIINVPTVGTSTGFETTQKYYYDSLNRIDDATEEISSQIWRQDFSYDRYGNRNFVEANTTFAGFEKLCNSNTELCADLRKKLNPSVNTGNNRFNTGQDYSYDSSGNTTGDPHGRTFVYDAENKQISVSDSSGTIGQYWYDGDGKRVKKFVPSTGEAIIFVYDAAGKVVAEYSTIVEPIATAKAAYLTNDHLGSPRINTDANGVVTARHDYHPFGEEIATSQRTSGLGYVEDTVRKQFTGYERDSEIELDFAQARYYNPAHGRFTTTDPLMASGRTENPQTWNRYNYVGNNPLVNIDPTGEDWIRSNKRDENGQYTYHDVYGKELKAYLKGGNYSRVDFGGADSSIIERNGNPIYEMFAKGGGQEISTASEPDNRISNLVGSIAENSVTKGTTVLIVAGTGVAIGTGAGLAMAATGTAAGTGVTVLGLSEAGAGVGAAAAANPEKAGQVLQGASQLPQKVLENFKRFASKVPQNARSNAGLDTTADGGYRFTATSVGNVPGSKAIYQKVVDGSGRTIGYLKTTIDPKGNIVHVKDKMK